ncbi:MAG: Holliday junction resolvase [Clostridiales bacterium 43-6]|nr:MAG: Holliday junction resolvase [Clostridiales bacterium 43-6]
MKIMAVDLGLVRTGLAVCDKSEFLASPLCVIKESKENALIDAISQKAAEHKIELLVVGYPKNMDGSAGERAEKCKGIAHMLHEKNGLPVELWDERCTTVMAHNMLNVTDTRGKKRKEIIDAVAATILLEDYLNYRKNKNG